MIRSKALGLTLLAGVFLGFLALLARTLYEALAFGSVDQTTVSMLIVSAFVILAGIAVLASQGRMAALAARMCPACGSHVYATMRTSDRVRLLTCFSCGHENLVAA